jgi:hypothetical protein
VDSIYSTDSARQLTFDDSFKNPIKSYVISKCFTVEFKTKQQTHNYLPSSQLQAPIASVHHNKMQTKATIQASDETLSAGTRDYFSLQQNKHPIDTLLVIS